MQDAQAVLGGHRPRRAGGHGLLAEPVVEAAGDLALAVQRHRALLDAAHHQHRAQQPDPVLGGQVLRYVRGHRGALSRLGRHQASLLPLRCRAGPGIAGLASAVARGLRGARCDAARVGHRGVTLGAMHAPGQVERLWVSRLRWRLRGAWQWPAFGVLTVIDAVLLTRLPFYGEGPGTLVAGLLVAAFANLLAVAVVGPLAGLRLRRRRPDLPKLIADRLRVDRRARAHLRGLPRRGAAPPAGGRGRARGRRGGRGEHARLRRRAGAGLPRRAGGDGRHADRGGPLPLVRPGAGPAALAVPVRDAPTRARRGSPPTPTRRPTPPTGGTAASARLASASALRRRSRDALDGCAMDGR